MAVCKKSRNTSIISLKGQLLKVTVSHANGGKTNIYKG